MRHIISVLLENESGALSRVAGLFSARGYNIELLTVGPTQDPSLSRMTIVTSGSDEIVEQILKQLNKLIEVVKVLLLTEKDHVERELLLVKVLAQGAMRDEIKRLTEIFRGHIVDVTEACYTVEVTGDGDKINAFLRTLPAADIQEVVRTGVAAIARGETTWRLP